MFLLLLLLLFTQSISFIFFLLATVIEMKKKIFPNFLLLARVCRRKSTRKNSQHEVLCAPAKYAVRRHRCHLAALKRWPNIWIRIDSFICKRNVCTTWQGSAFYIRIKAAYIYTHFCINEKSICIMWNTRPTAWVWLLLLLLLIQLLLATLPTARHRRQFLSLESCIVIDRQHKIVELRYIVGDIDDFSFKFGRFYCRSHVVFGLRDVAQKCLNLCFNYQELYVCNLWRYISLCFSLSNKRSFDIAIQLYSKRLAGHKSAANASSNKKASAQYSQGNLSV